MKSNSGPLTIAYLGVLAGLQVVDPTLANIGLVDAGRALRMEGSMLALAASLSTLAQAAERLGGFAALGNRWQSDRPGRAAGGGVSAGARPDGHCFGGSAGCLLRRGARLLPASPPKP